MKPTAIFDGHNDVLLRLYLKRSATPAEDFIAGDGLGHIDMPRLKSGGIAGGLFAIFAPDLHDRLPDDDNLNPPLGGQLSRKSAAKSTEAMLAILNAIEVKSEGEFKLCRSVADIRAAMKSGAVAAVTHMEGAEALAADLDGIEELHARGLRSVGPVWSRPNVFGHGVPFRFPSHPNIGGGLTDAGFALVKSCNALRIAIDLSHLNERGFWDVEGATDAPLIASHSNAHAICNSSRNLTDDQVRAISERGGLIGLNFATGFLREDGRWNTDTHADIMIRHLEHLLQLAGEDCVGFGSDFDGARIPQFIKDAAGSQQLVEAMRTHGFSDTLIDKIACENWLRVLELTWGS